MMYRVFLKQKEPGWFKIRYGELLSWYHNCPHGWKPSIEEQEKRMDYTIEVFVRPEPIDNHWIVQETRTPIAISHDREEAEERAYESAKEIAQRQAKKLSKIYGMPFVIIDITPKGDRDLAERLAEEVYEEEVLDGGVSGIPSKAVDIGD